MTIDDIKQIIAADESIHLELKKTTGELKDGMHSACAFLNTDGGWLIFGVTPKSKKIIGQQVTDATQREIAQALSSIEPSIHVNVEYIDVPDHPDNKIIAMFFDGWKVGLKPYTYHGRPYIKIESTTKIMSRDMFEERIRLYQPSQYFWERQFSNIHTINDLDEDRIRGSIRLGVDGGRLPAAAITSSITDFLSKSDLYIDGKVTNAAVMLFANYFSGYPQLKLRLARFIGTDKSEFIDNQRVQGNFFDLLDAGMAFLFKHLNLSGKITGIRREEYLEIPVTALREALINALCHRQYEKDNLTIGIAIYDDRIEISNPGFLPPQITPETIKQPHDSYPYNPIIAEFLFRTTFLENWGSGAQRIIEACNQQNIEEPIWSVNGDFVTISIKRPNYDPSKTQVRLKYNPSSAQVAKLIKVIADDKFHNMKELLAIYGLKSLKRFRENYINSALSEGALVRKYPNKPNHPAQQYRLSDIAIEWLNNSSRND